MAATRREFAVAARGAAPVWVGLYLLGVGFGVLLSAHRLPWWLAPIISVSVLAGSAEFLLIGLFATGASVFAVALTTFLVNARHLFYGLAFPLERRPGLWRKLYSIWTLCDEAFALLTAHEPESLSSGVIGWTQFGLHASWATGSLTGGLLGATLLTGLHGLGFILPGLFVVLALDAYRATRDHGALAAAVVCALLAQLLAPSSMLLLALAALSAFALIRGRLLSRSTLDLGALGGV